MSEQHPTRAKHDRPEASAQLNECTTAPTCGVKKRYDLTLRSGGPGRGNRVRRGDPPTPRQLFILQLIDRVLQPSVREIAATSATSTNTVADLLRGLERRGIVRRAGLGKRFGGRSRAVDILDRRWLDDVEHGQMAERLVGMRTGKVYVAVPVQLSRATSEAAE